MKSTFRYILAILLSAVFFVGTAPIQAAEQTLQSAPSQHTHQTLQSAPNQQTPQTLQSSQTQTPQNSGITVMLNGNPVIFDQPPLLINGRVMVPIRAVAEAMGWEVRAISPAVVELSKAVRYTDGTRNFLFSIHTVIINLERELLNRSIMVGVGRFFDTEQDRNIPLTAAPIITSGITDGIISDRTLIGVRDLAECLYATVEWDGATQTVIITSGTIPYYDGQGLENRDELFEQMRTFNRVSGELVRLEEQSIRQPNQQPTQQPAHSQSNQQPTPPHQPQTTPNPDLPFQPSGVMTEAPLVGSFPANIMLTGKTDVTSRDSFHHPYRLRLGHGCNWYAFGRFYETHGFQNPVRYTGGATYLDVVEQANSPIVRAERDLTQIVAGSIAVYWRQNRGGHVVFVEYVSRDEHGNPLYVYYTEAMNSDGSGRHRPASDGRVKRVTFERFMRSTSGTKDLMGFVMPR